MQTPNDFLPRRSDKEWRREYDKQYRLRTKEKRKIQTQEYRSNPIVKQRIKSNWEEWYRQNKKRVIQKLKNKKQTIDGKIYYWKLGAKRRNVEWNLSDDFLKSLPLVCHYTGEHLTMDVGFPNTLSIDRIDSSKPYSCDNVVPCCSMINRMKQEFNKDDFIKVCHKIATHNKL